MWRGEMAALELGFPDGLVQCVWSCTGFGARVKRRSPRDAEADFRDMGSPTYSNVRSPGLPSDIVHQIFWMAHLASKSLSHKEIASESATDLIERLHAQARFLANNLAMGLPAVIAERERLEKMLSGTQQQPRLAFLKREQEAALMAPVRLEIYHLELLRHPPFCPYCWMLEGRRTPLKPMLAEAEALGCEVCGSAY